MRRRSEIDPVSECEMATSRSSDPYSQSCPPVFVSDVRQVMDGMNLDHHHCCCGNVWKYENRVL